MSEHVGLGDHLAKWAGDDARRRAAALTIVALASACRGIADMVAAGALVGDLTAHRAAGIGGDVQKEIDLRANSALIEALWDAPVAAVVSEEVDMPVALKAGAPIVVALDPLDGSSNIDTNVSVGTIFSLLPTPPEGSGNEPAAFLRPGREQVAAGYFLYGPQTALVLTLGDGTDIFILDRASGTFLLTKKGVRVSPKSQEFAVNASNYRHWDTPVRIWFDDCLAGSEGPRGADFNMRWIASMVAEAHRILSRGGIYLYPGDARKGYATGRLRLLYEANPIAFLMEQAGAAASTGRGPILDCMPRMLHERVPLVFGSREEVERLDRYHIDPHPIGERSPLFGRRGLFRA
jgi:fructose-1,6-bisphosphatase I